MGIMNRENKESKREKMTREESFDLIEKWVESSGARIYGDDLVELQDVLWQSVVSERLVLEEGTKRDFKYVLEEPIVFKDGSGAISMMKIKSSKIGKVFETEKYKSEGARATAMIKLHCSIDKDGEDSDIQIGFIERLFTRDSIVIQAVIMAFFF
jgi:hypothetical protein